jgi:hypothetical protein
MGTAPSPGGTLLKSTVTIVSSIVNGGLRTVVITRPALGPTPQHANFTLQVSTMSSPSTLSVFERNLQCEPVSGVNTGEECHWSHACKSFKRAGVGTNGILECKPLPKNAHRSSVICIQPVGC